MGTIHPVREGALHAKTINQYITDKNIRLMSTAEGDLVCAPQLTAVIGLGPRRPSQGQGWGGRTSPRSLILSLALHVLNQGASPGHRWRGAVSYNVSHRGDAHPCV